jgi:hypothetical protein
MQTKLTILTFLLLNILTYSEIRYVSPQGNNTAPFISWATASNTIQGCIDVSSPGDTIYVDNGVYKEVVNMIRKLALIGSGIDSCIIDTRELATETNFVAVTMQPYCTFEGFYLIVSNQNWGVGVLYRSPLFSGEPGLITNNKIVNAGYGIRTTNLDKGYLRNNILVQNVNSKGIQTGAFENAQTIIEGNYITLVHIGTGILSSIGGKPILRNNVIIGKDITTGIWGGGPDSLFIYNNLLLIENALGDAITLTQNPMFCYNNIVKSKNNKYGIQTSDNNYVINNFISGNKLGIYRLYQDEVPIIKYNNSWQNEVNYSDLLIDSTNLSVDPMFVNEDSLDFHLQRYSPLIDAGDPEILDKDGSRSDIGLLGGPYGSEEYKYIDYPPRPPVILDVVVDSLLARIILKRNTEADFSHYNIYRSSTPNFIIDSLNLIKTTEDTSFMVRINEEKYYYKITGIDKQGNESRGSEEIELTVTGIEENKVVLEDYKLYQNYPNPFNPSTIISYRIPERVKVNLSVYDIKGEKINELVNQEQEKGYYEVKFDARESKVLSSGIYLYKLEVYKENKPVYRKIEKMILLK